MTARILIADDDASIRRLVRRIVEEHPNWEVCGEAIDGQDAVAKTAELAPDVVILDLAMPEKNGFQAAREISEKSPKLPMMLLTVQDASAELDKEARRAGFRVIISKYKGTEVVQGIEFLLSDQAPGTVPANPPA
jgi:DNA-binding NarL/FixJ family response regulator